MSEREAPIRAGVIGLGRIGHGFGVSPSGDPLCHTESYARVPGVELVLGVDPNLAALASFAGCFPRAAALASAADISAGMRVDVVSVASPTPERAAGVEAALRLGARVILAEKPLADTVAEAEAIAARCRAAGATLIVNYSRRWTPMLAAMRAAVAPGGRLGPPVGASIRYTGGLIHNGTHWIDLLVALLGPPTGVAPAEVPPQAAAEQGILTLRFWSGCVAHLVRVGVGSGPGWSLGEGELWSAAGMLRFSQSGARVTFQPRVASAWAGFHALGPEEVLVEDGLHGHLLGAVREAVELARQARYGVRDGGTRGEPTCDAADGLCALSVAERGATRRAA